MYLFRENTSLGRLKSDRVGFMDCLFSVQIKIEYEKYLKSANRRSYKWDNVLLSYVNGELPSHGKTMKKWAVDFDRIYAPVFVNDNHWIAVCVNFSLRTVEVLDCANHHNRRNVEAFAFIIPRLVKEIHTKANGKQPLLSQYNIIEVPLPRGLNKSNCDCGVYALKSIECHLLQLRLDLINDDNIKEARLKLAVDLWEAANDPVLIDRMEKHEPPPKLSSDIVNID